MTDKVTYQKCEGGSYLYMFAQRVDGLSISAYLNGYAIIPIEDYPRLIEKDQADQEVMARMEKIKDCDQQLPNAE